MSADNINYSIVFEKAEQFALSYSKDIYVDESHKETISENGIDYACVPLSFTAKGNRQLLKQIMDSGFCSKMNGQIVNGKRIIKVLLWIDTDTYNYYSVPNRYLNF